MNRFHVFWLTAIAMIAFAGNSLLCRMALKSTTIDPVTFTAIRLLSGILVLGCINFYQHPLSAKSGNWTSSIALFIYALFFSVAYISLPTGIGAILLFGSVQLTMLSYGLMQKERFNSIQTTGFVLAIVGIGALFWPGMTAPPVVGSLLMIVAGLAWGIYSIKGKKSSAPIADTFGNFLRTLPFILIGFMLYPHHHYDQQGVIYALLSGAIASGIGYSIWYAILPKLTSIFAASIQLSVPILASLLAVILLNENLTFRLPISSIAVLAGIGLVIIQKNKRPS
jgi:drug/metabolite transporter (DMT)-like permease